MAVVSGNMYLVTWGPHSLKDKSLYACAPKRIWWKPWRWNLRLEWIVIKFETGQMFRIEPDQINDLSYYEMVGLMKLYNCKHPDIK